MKGYGPAITKVATTSMTDRILIENGLSRLIPTFKGYAEDLKVLSAAATLPDPLTVSASEPEIIDFMWEIPGLEPEIAFPYFIKGAAICALGLDQSHHENIKQALIAVATEIIDGKELPPIDSVFTKEVERISELIVGNGEMPSWRSLLAFSYGAFWLLSFVKEPFEYNSNGEILGLSVYEYVCRAVASAAQLAYVRN